MMVSGWFGWGFVVFVGGAVRRWWSVVLAVVLAAGVAVPAGAGVRGREVGGVVLWSGAAGELSVSWEALVVRVRFSEPLAVSYVTMRDGGAVLVSSEHRVVKAKRVERRSDLWAITIRVGSEGTVAVTVPEGSGCEGANAVCTADGRPVAERALVFVPGPGSDPDDPRVESGLTGRRTSPPRRLRSRDCRPTLHTRSR